MIRNISILLVFCLISYALGAYINTSPDTVKEETKSEVKKEDVKTVITRIKKPNGEVTTVVTKETQIVTNSELSNKESSVSSRSKYTISALVAVDYLNLREPIYGGMITKQFVGPLNAGIWGLSNGVVGITIGVSF